LQLGVETIHDRTDVRFEDFPQDARLLPVSVRDIQKLRELPKLRVSDSTLRFGRK
jgi:hypothetical protein